MTHATLALIALALPAAGPLALHPDNPRYFLFQDRPTFLLTSGEHYGAVLNLDFDYRPYLDELAARGFNLTRTFSGTYREVPGSFKIRANTLAPEAGRFACPWARRGEKFDLDQYDDSYFRRLKDFLGEAGRRGIVVEYVLFCPLYEDELWDVSPMNARNNVNGVGDCPRTEALTLKHPELVKRQVAFVEKVVEELKDVDNLYYEVCNEPYFGGVADDWQARIAETIAGADGPRRHLIARNIANGKAKVERLPEYISILNFHYATPPETVALNAGLDRPIADDETGFRGIGDAAYRQEAWEFLLAGGAIFDNLDYSFTTELEAGDARVEEPTPGGGGPKLRAQLATLGKFLRGFDFVRMKPATDVVRSRAPDGGAVRALAEPGRAYAVYARGGTWSELALDLPRGRYRVEWLDPITGKGEPADALDHGGGAVTLRLPREAGEFALKLVADGRD